MLSAILLFIYNTLSTIYMLIFTFIDLHSHNMIVTLSCGKKKTIFNANFL